MNKPPMVPVSRYEPSKDALLGALDVEISASLTHKNFAVSGQNSARSVVDFGPNPAHHQSMHQHQNGPSWMNHSCPNLGAGWNPRDLRESHPRADVHESMNRSAPHMMLDFDMTSSPPRSVRRMAPTSEDMMDVEPTYSNQISDDMGSDSYGDDLILSPIGDGSPRRLFNSLSNLDSQGFDGGTGVLRTAPMLD